MNTNIQNRKNSYAIAAGCFLFLAQKTSGEVVYTNVDPESVLINDNDYFNIDIDNNGITDFKLRISTGSFSTPYFDYYSYFYYIIASPFMSGNRIAGAKSVIDPSYGGFTQYFPFALSENAMINEDLTFQNNNFQPLAYMVRNEDGGGGPSGGEWFDGIENHFIGVRFYDDAECLHYGWIRCDVGPDVESLVVKDYAFETNCNTGIVAGDTIGDTTSVAAENFNLLNLSLYSYGKNIYIQGNELINNLEINIYNMTGNKVFGNKLNTQSTQITLHETKGIYIVELISDGEKYTKKIFIN